MSWAFVQGKHADQGAGSSLGATLTSNVTVGNRLVVICYVYGSGVTLSQVADNLGNQGANAGKYDQVQQQNDPFNGKLYWLTAPITTGGSCTVTATATGSASFMQMWVGEYSGLSTITGSGAWDVMAGNNGTVATSMASGTTAPTNNTGELAVLAFGDTLVGATAGFNVDPGVAWTQRDNTSTTSATSNLPIAVYDQTPSSGANVSATWTCPNSDAGNGFATGIVTFILQPITGPTTPVIGNAAPGQAWAKRFKGKPAVTSFPILPPPQGDTPSHTTKRVAPQPKARFKRPVVTAGTVGVVYNSSGVTPIVVIGVQKPKPKQKKPYTSATTTGTPYTSGGVTPTVVVSIQKPRVRRYKANIVVPPIAVVVIQGAPPIVTVALQKTKPRSKPPYTSETTTGVAFNSGGLTPSVTRGRYPAARQISRQPLVRVALTYNSAGITPIVVLGIQKRPKPTRPKSHIIPAQVFNSGSLKPIVTVGKQKPKPINRRPSVFAPAYNSGGITPLVIIGRQKKRPTKGGSKVIIAPASAPVVQGAKPSVTIVLQKPKPLLRKVSRLVIQPTVALLGTKPITTISIQKRAPLSKRPVVKPGRNILFNSYQVTLSVASDTRPSVAPGLFKSGAFADAIVVQFRPFRIRLANKVDKSQ